MLDMWIPLFLKIYPRMYSQIILWPGKSQVISSSHCYPCNQPVFEKKAII